MKFNSFSETGAKALLFTTVLVSAIGFFNVTSINVAIPKLQEDFDASISIIQWITSSFTLVLSILILISGSLSDVFGRKRMLIVGIIIFSIAGFFSGIAPNVELIIASRVLQGIGSAFMVPQSLAIINNAYSDKIKGTAIGIWGGMSGAINVLAPFFTGFVVDAAGWRYVFFITIPFALLLIPVIIKFIPNEKIEQSKSNADWGGAMLIGIALLLFSGGLIEASNSGFDNPFIIAAIVTGAILTVSFYFFEKRVTQPLVDFRIFKSRTVLAANLFTFFMYATIGGVGLFFTLYIQQLLGESAATSGLVFIPLSLTITALSFFTGSIADKYGARIMLTLGGAFVSVGYFTFITVGDMFEYFTTILPGAMLIGIGFGIFVPAVSKAALAVDSKYSGMASGFNNSVSRIAGLFAVAILGTTTTLLYGTFLETRLDDRTEIPTEIRTEVNDQFTKLLEIEIPDEATETQVNIIQTDIDESFLEAFRIQLILLGISAGLATVCAFFFLPGRESE